MDTTTKVIDILAAQSLRDPATIGPNDTLATLGLDSLGLVEVIFALEEAFDIAIPFNANDPGDSGFDISSVAGLIGAVEGLLGQKAA
jgi:acyl carrier protein